MIESNSQNKPQFGTSPPSYRRPCSWELEGQVLRAHRSSAGTCILRAGPAPSWGQLLEEARAQDPIPTQGVLQCASQPLWASVFPPVERRWKRAPSKHTQGAPGAAEGRHGAEPGLRNGPTTCQWNLHTEHTPKEKLDFTGDNF